MVCLHGHRAAILASGASLNRSSTPSVLRTLFQSLRTTLHGFLRHPSNSSQIGRPIKIRMTERMYTTPRGETGLYGRGAFTKRRQDVLTVNVHLGTHPVLALCGPSVVIRRHTVRVCPLLAGNSMAPPTAKFWPWKGASPLKHGHRVDAAAHTRFLSKLAKPEEGGVKSGGWSGLVHVFFFYSWPGHVCDYRGAVELD